MSFFKFFRAIKAAIKIITKVLRVITVLAAAMEASTYNQQEAT